MLSQLALAQHYISQIEGASGLSNNSS